LRRRTTLLPQHLKLHYFALYADVKEPFETLCFEPVYLNWFFQSNNRENSKRGVTKMVGLIGLEPMTLRLSSACSNQLSYRPFVVQLKLLTCRQKWRHGGSNPGHPACKAGALPTELYPRSRRPSGESVGSRPGHRVLDIPTKTEFAVSI
jgi:hypothetical protein